MSALILSLLTLGGSDVDRLGVDDFAAREAAEERLRFLGPLPAVRLLAAAATSESPEVRQRAGRLLTPYLRWWRDACAAAVLLDPWPVDPAAWWSDRDARERVRKVALAAGVPPDRANGLVPDDEFDWWAGEVNKPGVAAFALRRCREWLGVPVPPPVYLWSFTWWPFEPEQ